MEQSIEHIPQRMRFTSGALRRSVAALVVALATVVPPTSAWAQNYPVRPVRVINTVAAGGPAEMVARTLGQKLTEFWGQQIVVDTRAGAAGTIGADIVARSTPDGYTLLLGSGATMVIAPLVQKAVPYDPIKDFAQVSMVVMSPFGLFVHPSVGARSLPELIAAAKAKPGQFNFGSAGVGSTAHLGAEQLKMLSGIDIRHVPYKGAVPAVADIVAGQIQILFGSMASSLPHAKAGRLHLLASGGAKRSALAPETPTLNETFSGYEVVTWYSIVGPAKLPPAIVAQLNADIGRALASPEIIARLSSQGHDPHPSTPEAMREYTRSEIAKFAKLIKAAGVKPE